ncbi:MAG: glycosyltransferase family 39 protein [bacterium]|nr:glycosyltransferase family 39 protein [bacterium]
MTTGRLGTFLGSLRGQILLFLCGIALVAPWGNFPLNDDWSYARVVDGLVNRGVIDVAQGWASMTLMSVVAWGTVFTKAFGFSHVVLRLSTVTAALISIWLMSRLLTQRGGTRDEVNTATALMLANPVFFCLSLAFMTDVPFLMFALLATLLCVNALVSDRAADYVLFLVALLVAMMARQFAVLIAAAFGAAYIFTRSFTVRNLLRAGLPLLLCVALYALHQQVLFPVFGFPNLRSVYVDQAAGRFSDPIHLIVLYFARSAVGLLLTLGLYLSPFLILRVRSFRDVVGFTRTGQAITLAWMGLVVAVLVQGQRLMPLVRNVVYDFGVGPPRLMDVLPGGTQVYADAPALMWAVVTLFSCVASCVLLHQIIGAVITVYRNWRQRADAAPIQLFALFYCAAYLVVIVVVSFFDRFLIALMPILLLLLISTGAPSVRSSRWQIGGAVALAVVLFVFSVAGTHDYHAWNRARWTALDRLSESMQISPMQIDGGIEFNGTHTYATDYQRSPDKSWWWVIDDRYAVTFGPVDGYDVIGEEPFRTWLPWCNSSSIKMVAKRN